ncbi:cellulose biosynthesis protein BcsE [Paraburkholderia sp. GAS42]|uniref:cellulose biosynthesis protein BcsE n=1 Tax=Paraburkholderia sp. GAS42 TaxID=3035135 RepID=UPI003D23B596
MSTDSNRTSIAPVASGLRRWLRVAGWRGAGGRTRQPERLAVDCLPDEWVTLAPGKLYAIYMTARTPASDALIWTSAREARTKHVTVVLARPRAEVAKRLRELGFAGDGPARGWPRGLNVLAMPAADFFGADGDASQPVAFARLFGGLRALKRFGFHSNALYFIEGAERWFSVADPVALAREGRMLADWCKARNITLVLMFGPTSRVDDDPDSDDERFADETLDGQATPSGRLEFHGACAGVARLQRTHGELLWHVDFWRAGRALVTGAVRSLRFTDGGRLTVAPDSPDALGAGVGAYLARDEDRVVASRAVVGNEAWVPREWDIVADQRAALAACEGAQAATVLLEYTGGAQLEALCAAVHTLRRRCGRALKIVVVERGEVLRHQYELLVLNLGANLVIGRHLPFSRIQSLLQSLQGQLHTRPVADDYRTALAAALSDDVLGYLPVTLFSERTRAVLERSAALRLPHALVKLTLLPSLSHVDALRHCTPRRAGDVFTMDASHIYVFLFACRLADAGAALAHVFDVPVARLSDRVVYLAEEGIAEELKSLEAAQRRAPVADYSDLFPATAAAAAVVTAAVPESPNASNGENASNAGELLQTIAAAQLDAIERALADARGESTRTGAIDGADDTPRVRHAEPCAMPLRTTEDH